MFIQTKGIDECLNNITLDVEKQIKNNPQIMSNIKDCISKDMTYTYTSGSFIDKDSYVFEVSYLILLSSILSYILEVNYNCNCDYRYIIKILDNDNVFGWYIPNKEIIENIENTLKNSQISNVKIDELIDYYEIVLNKKNKKGFGQFYTPSSIVRTIIKETKLNSLNINLNESIIDPACGAGIFLVELVKSLKRRGIKGIELAKFAFSNLYGNDINPFAIILTKLNLSFEIISALDSNTEINVFLDKYFSFPNISQKDTITLEDNRLYSYIVGNPPYFKITNKKFENYKYYKDVIFGQPNIYAIFLYWAIKHCDINGKISFIIPQSFRTGLYFKELRRKLFELKIISIINFESRKKIFKEVEQAVLIITLQNTKKVLNSNTKISFVKELNLKDMDTHYIESKKLNLGEKYDFFFFLPKENEMYGILDKIYSNSTNFREMNSDWIFGNGLFVWNQNKKHLIDNNINESAPIIYSNFISQYKFEPKNVVDIKREKKAFCKITDDTKKFLLSGKRLLVQRTSNFEKVKRIKASIINSSFLEKYNSYYLENHTNLLYNKGNKAELVDDKTMYFHLAILNSLLINYIFVCKNGNTQVSATELNLLPINFKNYKDIVTLSKKFEKSNIIKTRNHIEDLIFDSYDLTGREIDIIKEHSR